VHHVLRLDCHQALHELSQNEPSLNLAQVALACFDESIDVTSVAKLHNQVVVRLGLGASDKADDMSVLNLSHDFDFINEQLMVFALDALAINHLHGVVLVWVLTQVAVVNGTVLSTA